MQPDVQPKRGPTIFEFEVYLYGGKYVDVNGDSMSLLQSLCVHCIITSTLWDTGGWDALP